MIQHTLKFLCLKFPSIKVQTSLLCILLVARYRHICYCAASWGIVMVILQFLLVEISSTVRRLDNWIYLQTFTLFDWRTHVTVSRQTRVTDRSINCCIDVLKLEIQYCLSHAEEQQRNTRECNFTEYYWTILQLLKAQSIWKDLYLSLSFQNSFSVPLNDLIFIKILFLVS